MNTTGAAISYSLIDGRENSGIVIERSDLREIKLFDQQSLFLGAEFLDGGADFGDRAHARSLNLAALASKANCAGAFSHGGPKRIEERGEGGGLAFVSRELSS